MMPKPEKKIELVPNAWKRFERAVDVVAKSSPQHRVKKSSAKRKRSPKRKNSKKRG